MTAALCKAHSRLAIGKFPAQSELHQGGDRHHRTRTRTRDRLMPVSQPLVAVLDAPFAATPFRENGCLSLSRLRRRWLADTSLESPASAYARTKSPKGTKEPQVSTWGTRHNTTYSSPEGTTRCSC